ncbi:MAG: hypothetical protein ACR2HN_09715 [Tepidiformaceae bacterium]
MGQASGTGERAFDDGLTPSERGVLDHIRAGQLDAEIAVRLGVPIGDVKERVAALIRKTGVAERRELAAWRAEGGSPAEERGGPAGELSSEAPATDGVAEGAPRPRSRAFVAGLVLGGAAVAVGLGAVAYLAGGGGQRREERAAAGDAATPASTEEPLAPAEPTPDPRAPLTMVNGLPVRPLTVGPALVSFNGWMLIEKSCVKCEQSVASIQRVWWPDRGRGEPVVETLFQSPYPGSYITAVTADAEGKMIAATVCKTGACRSGSLDAGTTALFQSLDGGVTWTELTTLPGAVFASAVTMRAIVLEQRRGASGERPEGISEYSYYGEKIPVKPGGTGSVGMGWRLLGTLADGDPVWATSDGFLVTTSGRAVPGPAISDSAIDRVVGSPGGGYLMSWHRTGAGVTDRTPYHGFVSANGDLTAVFSGDVRFSHFAAGFAIGTALIPVTGMGGGGPHIVPVEVDLATGRYFPIERPFIDEPPESAASRVVALQYGAFARVVTGPDCLNIREGPTTQSPSIDCVADGVLLGIMAGEREGWAVVETPGGLGGWASTEFLLR